MSRLLRRLGPLVALGALFTLIVGMQPAAADTGSVTNPKHFFWGKGQPNPNGTNVNSLANDLIYHGGNAGSGAIGVERPPAIYLIY
jgi:hypothetical protein